MKVGDLMQWTVEHLQETLKRNPVLKVNQKDVHKLDEIKSSKRHKYNAKPGWLDGYYFDSQAEMERYGELVILKLAGSVKDFKVHPKYDVGSGITYELDFEVIYQDGHKELEEVKGRWTQAARMKVKMFRKKYPDLPLKIIKNGEVVEK